MSLLTLVAATFVIPSADIAITPRSMAGFHKLRCRLGISHLDLLVKDALTVSETKSPNGVQIAQVTFAGWSDDAGGQAASRIIMRVTPSTGVRYTLADIPDPYGVRSRIFQLAIISDVKQAKVPAFGDLFAHTRWGFLKDMVFDEQTPGSPTPRQIELLRHRVKKTLNACLAELDKAKACLWPNYWSQTCDAPLSTGEKTMASQVLLGGIGAQRVRHELNRILLDRLIWRTSFELDPQTMLSGSKAVPLPGGARVSWIVNMLGTKLERMSFTRFGDLQVGANLMNVENGYDPIEGPRRVKVASEAELLKELQIARSSGPVTSQCELKPSVRLSDLRIESFEFTRAQNPVTSDKAALSLEGVAGLETRAPIAATLRLRMRYVREAKSRLVAASGEVHQDGSIRLNWNEQGKSGWSWTARGQVRQGCLRMHLYHYVVGAPLPDKPTFGDFVRAHQYDRVTTIRFDFERTHAFAVRNGLDDIWLLGTDPKFRRAVRRSGLQRPWRQNEDRQ